MFGCCHKTTIHFFQGGEDGDQCISCWKNCHARKYEMNDKSSPVQPQGRLRAARATPERRGPDLLMDTCICLSLFVCGRLARLQAEINFLLTQVRCYPLVFHHNPFLMQRLYGDGRSFARLSTYETQIDLFVNNMLSP